MSTQPRILITPRVESLAFASTSTARASHPSTLAELADDAAGGHVGQRMTLGRVTGTGAYAWYYWPSNARHLVVRASVSARGTYSTGHAVALALTATDGTHTAATAADGIPDDIGGSGSTLLFPAVGAETLPRAQSLAHYEWTISVEALASVLTAGDEWRVDVAVTCDATVYLEHLQIEELPRWLVDDAESYGQLPQVYLPRGLVVDGTPLGLPRLGETLRAAYFGSLRTYHAMTRARATPWSTTSSTWTTLAQDVEPGTGPVSYAARGRRLRSGTDVRVRWRVRYRITGASVGDVAQLRLVTGASGSPYAATLTDVSGLWTDLRTKTAYLKTSGVDRFDALHWQARTDAGTLQLHARTVVDHPL